MAGQLARDLMGTDTVVMSMARDSLQREHRLGYQHHRNTRTTNSGGTMSTQTRKIYLTSGTATFTEPNLKPH